MGGEEEELDVEEIVEVLEDLGIKSEDLDEVVHDVASQEASDANNAGLGEQVGYLLEHGWDADEIIAYLDHETTADGGRI